ncbi:MAG: hypothetical protein AAGG01_09290 [Planctomycetota bacterium]
MKYPSSLPPALAQFSRATAGTALALAASGLAAASPAPQVVTAEVVALPGPAAGVNFFQRVAGDGNGSWVASASALSGPAAGQTAFYGVLAGSGTTTPSILRVPQQLAGLTQDSVFRPEVRGDRIAYTSFSQSTGPGFTSWIDDTLIAAAGIPIGTSGLEWYGSGTPMLSDGQAFYVRGLAQPVGGGAIRSVLVRYPSEQVVLDVAVPTPVVNGPLTGIASAAVTPSGTTWAAVVSYESSDTGLTEQAIIVNGNVASVPLQPLDTELSSFESFGTISIDANFDLTFEAIDNVGRVIYRNGRVAFRGDFSSIEAFDSRDRFITHTFTPGELGLSYEGIPLDFPGASAVDADGDGDADPGWMLMSNSPTGGAAPLADGGVLTVASVQGPGIGSVRAVVRARLLLPDNVICEGELNSLGRGASIRVVGSDMPTFGNLQLRVTDRPAGILLPLVSRNSGFVANPAGSRGNLCLGGSIGRGVPVNGLSAVTFTMFPQAFPQPDGFEAAISGETWFFQAWYRDFQTGQTVTNFTSAVGVTFR